MEPEFGIEREPCFACAEPARIDAQICPRCHSSLLVDVTLGRGVLDDRTRYALARRLSGLGEGVPPFLSLQRSLSETQPTVARGVTRVFARRIAAIVAEEGITAYPHPSGAAQRPGRVGLWAIIGAGAAVVILGVAAVVGVGWRTQRALGEGKTTAASAAPTQPAPDTTPPQKRDEALSSRELAQRSLKSAVSLRCPNSVGSGFFIAPNAILTNAHVLCEGGGPIEVVLPDGHKLIGMPGRSDRHLDLALVIVAAEGTPLPLGDAADAEVGDKVVFVGSPIGLEFTVHEGSISSLSRSLNGVAYIQIDAKVNPGNSGGPLLNDRGRVLGVVSLKATAAEGIALVVPINYAYTGVQALVPAPAEAVGSTRFEEGMAARARKEGAEERETDEAANGTSDAQMLVAVSVDQYDRLVAHVVQAADARPGYRMITLKAWAGTEVVCTMKGDINEWTVLDEKAPPVAIDRAIVVELMKRRAMGKLYIGGAPLRWDLCPRERMRGAPVVLELEDADPRLSRLQVGVRAGYGRYY